MSFTQGQRPATQQEVLEGFIALLKAEFCVGDEAWDNDSIYWTDTENSEASSNLSRFITVYAGGGKFDQGALVGGVYIEDAQIAVKIWHRSEGDNKGRSEQSMFQTDDGLMPLKRRVLKALSGKMLVDQSNVQIAIETIKPQSCGEPMTSDGSNPLDSLAIAFAVSFEWDLS